MRRRDWGRLWKKQREREVKTDICPSEASEAPGPVGSPEGTGCPVRLPKPRELGWWLPPALG